MNMIFTFLSILGLLANANCANQKPTKPNTNEVIWTIERHSKKLKKSMLWAWSRKLVLL